MRNEEDKVIKVVENTTVEDVNIPAGMEMPELGTIVFGHIKTMTKEFITGPRRFEEVLPIDGARAFSLAVRKVLGTITESVEMGNSRTLKGQEVVYEVDGKQFTTSMLLDAKKVPDEMFKDICESLGIEGLPSYIEPARIDYTHRIEKLADIVGVAPIEVSASFQMVELQYKNRNFGQALLEEDPETGDFVLLIKTTRQYKHLVDAIVAETERQISENSIYRGRAYNFSEEKFIHDLQFDTVNHIVLPSSLTRLIRSKVANKISGKSTRGLSTNRYYLAAGKPGVGKTETARALGAYAVRNRMTFLTYMPKEINMEDFKRFLEFANKVGPSFVVIEDVEKMIDPKHPEQYSQMLEVIDGVSSKSRNLHVWFTTNHASVDDNKFTEKFLRRMNAIMNFDKRNEATIEGLFAVYMPNDWELFGAVKHVNDMLERNGRVQDEDFVPHPRLAKLVQFVVDHDFQPWAVKATIEGAVEYADDSGVKVLTTEHLLASAEEVLDQIHLAKAAPKEQEADTLGSIHASIAKQAVESVK